MDEQTVPPLPPAEPVVADGVRPEALSPVSDAVHETQTQADIAEDLPILTPEPRPHETPDVGHSEDTATEDARTSVDVPKTPDATAVEYVIEAEQISTDEDSARPIRSDEDRPEQTGTDTDELGQRGGDVLPEATVPETPMHPVPESAPDTIPAHGANATPEDAGALLPSPAVVTAPATRVYTAEDRKRSLEQKRKKKEQKLMRLYTAARERGYVTIAIARRVVKLKRTTALTYLNLLVTRGLLKRRGLGKKRRYVVV